MRIRFTYAPAFSQGQVLELVFDESWDCVAIEDGPSSSPPPKLNGATGTVFALPVDGFDEASQELVAFELSAERAGEIYSAIQRVQIVPFPSGQMSIDGVRCRVDLDAHEYSLQFDYNTDPPERWHGCQRLHDLLADTLNEHNPT